MSLPSTRGLLTKLREAEFSVRLGCTSRMEIDAPHDDRELAEGRRKYTGFGGGSGKQF